LPALTFIHGSVPIENNSAKSYAITQNLHLLPQPKNAAPVQYILDAVTPMNSTPSSQSDIQKPRSLTDREWQELLHAAHTDWFRYVFDFRWLLTTPTAMFAGAFIYSIAHAHGDFPAAVAQLLHSGFFTWGLGFLLLFRILLSSIDWFGKRKLARQLHVIPTTHDA
jgi:hypothetical protein